MKATKRILVVLVALLMVSSVLYAGPVRINDTDPTTDGAIWGNGGKAGPPMQTEGAIWGADSLEIPTQQGNGSAEGAYRQSIIDLMKSLGRGLGLLVEGAIWG